MKAALSIVLAGLLVTLPIKQVLAQAVQQEVGSEQRTAPPDGHRLIGVPPVTDNTSRLWEPLASEDALTGIFAEDGLIPGPAAAPISKDAKTAMIVVAILAAVVIGLVLIANSISAGLGRAGT